MNSLRAIGIAGSILLASSVALSQDKLNHGHSNDQGSKSSQSSSGSKQDNRPSSGGSSRDSGPRNDQGSRMRDNGGSRNDQGSRMRDNGNSRNDQSGRVRDNGNSPRDNGNRPGRGDDNLRPGRGNGNSGGSDSFRPKPPERNDDNRRGGGDDLLRNGRGGSQGSNGSNNKPGDNYRPKPGERNDGGKRGGGDDLFRPGRGGNQGGGSNGQRSDGNDGRPIYNGPSGGGGNGQLGRIDSQGSRPSSRPVSDSLLGKKGNNYGGQINNLNRNPQSGRPISIDRAPVDIFHGGLQHQVRREDNIRIVNRSCRTGYYSYYNNWCDDNFFFGLYVFDPFVAPCYVSPWYYYPHLPGYLSPRCCHVVSISLVPWYGSYYEWHQPYGYDNYSSTPLDYAVDDIQRMFDKADERALRRLLPYNDRVAIFVDGEYSYSMDPEDFESFMLDNIDNTKTIRYEITRVERHGREAQVEARHEYEDTWGRRTTVYHSFRLEMDRGNYVITRFGTSYYRN